MTLDNFVHSDFGNTSLTLLSGQVKVELGDKNISLLVNQSLQLPADSFHRVHTVSSTASCYMYVFVNTTHLIYRSGFEKFEADLNKSASINETLRRYSDDPNLPSYQRTLASKHEVEKSKWQELKSFLLVNYSKLKRSMRLTILAIYCLTTNTSFNDYLDSNYS